MTAPTDTAALSRLPAGARRALMAMGKEWAFAGKATFSVTAGRALASRKYANYEFTWHCGRWGCAYRLNAAGLRLQALAKEVGDAA